MLKLTVKIGENFDERTSRFVPAQVYNLELEHSLASLSKWESEHEKVFLSDAQKTPEESLSYFQAMCFTPEIPPEVFWHLSPENIDAIQAYIGAKKTATWFSNNTPKKTSREVITAEVIYHWMFALNIPLECEHWHLNQLLTLIKVCNEKNSPPKKMDKRTAMAEQRRLNAERQAALKTRG